MRHRHTHNAHSVLELLISRAILEGRLGRSVLTIPMRDFDDHFEGVTSVEEAQNTILRIKIDLEWDVEDEPEENLETEFEEGDESEDDDGFN